MMKKSHMFELGVSRARSVVEKNYKIYIFIKLEDCGVHYN